MDQNQHENHSEHSHHSDHSHHSEHSHHSHHSHHGHHKHHSKHKSHNAKKKISLSIRKSALVLSVIALVLSITAVVGAIVLQSSVYGLKYNAENSENDKNNSQPSLDTNTSKPTESQDENIPEYWIPALEKGAKEINIALAEAGKSKSAFLFYSDAHWNVAAKNSPLLLRYLYENTGMNKTIFGGDIVSDESAEYQEMSYLWTWRRMIKDLPNHHSVVGNHDDGNATNNLFSESYVYGYLIGAEETPDMVMGEGFYYYIDNPAEQTRYLYLDTAYKGFDDAQRAFVNNALLTTPDKWHVVATAHIWYDTDYTTTPPRVAGISNDARGVLSIFDSYNARAGEFAESTGRVEFCIGGHTHQDYDGRSDGGIPIILVETASEQVRNGKTDPQYIYNQNTATESAVSGIIADYTNRRITVARVGRGVSRIVPLPN